MASLLIGLVAAAIILFQMQYLAASFAWAVVHGAGLAGLRALLLPALAMIVLWGGWFIIKYKAARHRTASTFAFSVAVVIAVEALTPVTPIKAHLQQQALASLQLQNISDESLLSAGGHPIGIRLAYEVTFPRPGAYSVSPSQYARLDGAPELYPLQFGHVLRTSIDPDPQRVADRPGARKFAADRPYRFVVESLPNFLRYDAAQSSYCLHFQPNTQYSDADVLSAIARSGEAKRGTVIQADGPSSFTRRVVVSEYTTRNAYSVKDIYDGAIREGIGNCGL